MGASPTCHVVPFRLITIIDVTNNEVMMHKKVENLPFLIPGNIRKKLKNMVIIKIYITTLRISSIAEVLFKLSYNMGPLSWPLKWALVAETPPPPPAAPWPAAG